MKRLFVCSGVFILFCAGFVLCYYLSYERALQKYNATVQERNEELLAYLLESSEDSNSILSKYGLERISEKKETGAEESEVIFVDTLQVDTVIPSTKYILETYDVVTDTLVTEELVPPGILIGRNREEIIAYMKDYMKTLPLTEYEKGLVSYELKSFSTDKLVMRKTYDMSLLPYKFYVNIVNGYVTVYYSDLETVYEYTHIYAADLSEEARIALNQGIFVKDREELYSLLEGYSS